MPVAIVFPPESVTPAQYEETVRRFERAGHTAPPGRLFHASYEEDGKIGIFDVWESEEAFLGQIGGTLVDALRAVGRTVPRPRVYPVYDLIDAAGHRRLAAAE